jgi:hypothetical protein
MDKAKAAETAGEQAAKAGHSKEAAQKFQEAIINYTQAGNSWHNAGQINHNSQDKHDENVDHQADLNHSGEAYEKAADLASKHTKNGRWEMPASSDKTAEVIQSGGKDKPQTMTVAGVYEQAGKDRSEAGMAAQGLASEAWGAAGKQPDPSKRAESFREAAAKDHAASESYGKAKDDFGKAEAIANKRNDPHAAIDSVYKKEAETSMNSASKNEADFNLQAEKAEKEAAANKGKH